MCVENLILLKVSMCDSAKDVTDELKSEFWEVVDNIHRRRLYSNVSPTVFWDHVSTTVKGDVLKALYKGV